MDAAISHELVEHWYESFREDFLKIGLKSGYTKEELSDMIGQFFLDLLEKNIDPRTIEHPKAYLSTAFRRKLIDDYRKSSLNRVVHTGKIPEEYADLSVKETLEQVQANAELISNIRKAYKKLPNRCQKVIYLKFYEGLTTEQIAAQTGLSKRTVYNNLFEGVKMLRDELHRQMPDVRFSALFSFLPLLITTHL